MKAFLVWFWEAIPRTPRREGILIRIYYWWTEAFTPAGKALAALALFSLFVFVLPGFSLAGFFLWGAAAISLVSLIVRRRRVNIFVHSLSVNSVTEGKCVTVQANVSSEKKHEMTVGLGIFRIPSPLVFEPEIQWHVLQGISYASLVAKVRALRRGAFTVHGARVLALQTLGFYRSRSKPLPPFEILVFPRVFKVLSFPFLIQGTSGREFSLLLHPSLQRGMEFIGVRQYREGDSPRDLHHRAFARYNRPFTKELAVERGSGMILLLDISASSLIERSRVEDLIRLGAGIGIWLHSRGILGRFFIGNEEIPLPNGSGRFEKEFLTALARIPEANLSKWKKIEPWAPEARPMGPVLGISFRKTENPLITKQIIISSSGESSENGLVISPSVLREIFEGKRKGIDL